MIGCMREASQHVINARVSSFKQTCKQHTSSFIYLLWKSFTSNHASQIYAAKKSFLELETLALIKCCAASLIQSIIFVQLYFKTN